MYRVIVFYLFATVYGARPIAKTEYGRVKGIEMKTYGGRTVYAFFNIPYTQRITSRRRFEELNDPDPWVDIFDAGGPPKKCAQITLSNELKGNENCLVVNIYSPTTPNPWYSATLYPVVVYFHGGAYYFFSGGDFGPRYILDKDVVLITFNYRLGIPGFGSTDDYILPGNLGLKDQVKALKWIQRNVRNFGGDKNSVTLVGMSSGAACVHFHYFSPMSRGLFHRGLISGGTATQFWSMPLEPQEMLELLAKNLKCPTNTSFDMVVCLERVPARELAMSIRTVQVGVIPISPVGPVLDEHSHNPFLTEYPYESIRSGRSAKLPLVFSNVLMEGIFPGSFISQDTEAMRVIDETWYSLGSHILGLQGNIPDVYLNQTLNLVRQFYFGDSRIDTSKEISFLQMLSDRYYLANSMKTLALTARHNPHTYYYIFDYKGGQSTAQRLTDNNERFGASHTDDILYMFNVTNNRLLESNSTDMKMVDVMTTMLLNFARSGVPSFGGDIEFQPVSQQTTIFGPINALVIKSPDNIRMEQLKNWGNIKFWESLPFLSQRKINYYKSHKSDSSQ